MGTLASNSLNDLGGSLAGISALKDVVGVQSWKTDLGGSLAGISALSRVMEGLTGSALMSAASSIALNGLRDKLASGGLAAFYDPEDEGAAVAAVVNVVDSPFTKVVDLGIVQEVAAIAGDPARVGRVLGTEDFSWESEPDVGALSQVTEQIKLEYGADWWAVFVTVIADMWSCRTPLGSGLGLRRSPEQIATLTVILCALMACFFVPQSAAMLDTAQSAGEVTEQVVGEVAVGAAVAFSETVDVVGPAVSSAWTNMAVPAGKYLWDEWIKDIIKNAIGGVLTTAILGGGALIYHKAKLRRKNVKRSDLKR